MSWTILKGKTITPTFPFDCVASINGSCVVTPFEKCIASCQTSDFCDYGYYNNGTCYALNTTSFENTDPYDTIISSDNPNDRVFINNIKYSQNPNANDVLYYDTVSLRNIETDTYLQPGEEIDIFALFAPFESDLTIEYKNVIIPRYRLEYGDEITLGIPNRPLILTRGYGKENWSPSYNHLSWNNLTPFSMMQISLFNLEKKNDDGDKCVHFNEPFYIKSINTYLCIDQFMHLIRTDKSLDYLKNTNSKCTFEFVPSKKLKASYCDDKNVCRIVPLNKTTAKGTDRYYEDKEVSRSDKCMFKCPLPLKKS